MHSTCKQLLTSFQNEKKSGRLFLGDPDCPGELFLEGGVLVHARTQDGNGPDAMRRLFLADSKSDMLSWEGGVSCSDQTLHLDAEATSLLLERYGSHEPSATTTVKMKDLQRESIDEANFRYRLMVKSPQLGSFDYILDKKYLEVGRNPHIELPIVDRSMSWSHAFLATHGGELFIHDLGSTNGTYINEVYTSFGVIRSGGSVIFGEVLCHFESIDLREVENVDEEIPLKLGVPESPRVTHPEVPKEVTDATSTAVIASDLINAMRLSVDGKKQARISSSIHKHKVEKFKSRAERAEKQARS